jgi:hypothetical protein
MSGHTQERLVVTSQDDFPTGCANFESQYGVDVIVLYHDNAKADARRIVQCWNAHDELVALLGRYVHQDEMAGLVGNSLYHEARAILSKLGSAA